MALAGCTQSSSKPSKRSNFTVVADKPRNSPAPPRGVRHRLRGQYRAGLPASRAARRSRISSPPPSSRALPHRYTTILKQSSQLKLSLSCG
ncbi:hypothetical protein D3C85_1756140 [compost metagenome]